MNLPQPNMQLSIIYQDPALAIRNVKISAV